MVPYVRPATRYWKKSSTKPLLAEDGELPVLHGQHLEGVDAEPVVVGLREVEDLVHRDLDAVLRGAPLHLLLARLAEPGVARQEADARDPHPLHAAEDHV